MISHATEIELDAWLDGELEAGAAAACAEHVASCARCAERVARVRRIKTALRARPIPEPPPEFYDALLERAKTPARPEPRAALRRRVILSVVSGALAAGLLMMAVLPLLNMPASQPDATTMTVTLGVAESRTVNLVFAAASALDDVVLTVELPPGVELGGRGGGRDFAFNTALAAGNNVLPLELKAVDARGGRLVARLRHGDREKTFVIDISVG